MTGNQGGYWKMLDKNIKYLEVGELRILLFEYVSHVINQMETKGIFGGDFLGGEKINI